MQRNVLVSGEGVWGLQEEMKAALNGLSGFFGALYL